MHNWNIYLEFINFVPSPVSTTPVPRSLNPLRRLQSSASCLLSLISPPPLYPLSSSPLLTSFFLKQP